MLLSIFNALFLLVGSLSLSTDISLKDNLLKANINSEETTVTLSNWTYYSGKNSDMFDGDTSTYLWLRQPSSSSYMDIKFKSQIDIYDLSITFASGTDYLKNGYFEWSNDSSNYMLIDNFNISNNEKVTIKCYGINATNIRLHAVDNNDNVWVKIAEININEGTFSNDLVQKISFANFSTNYLPLDTVGETSLNALLDGDEKTFTRFSRPTANEGYIQFDFNEKTTLSSLTYQNSSYAKEKYATNDRIYKSVIQYLDSDNNTYITVNDYYSTFFNHFGFYSSEGKDYSYTKQYVDLRALNISTSSIRMLITDSVGWLIAGNFTFNELKDSTKPVISVGLDTAVAIYDGELFDLFNLDPTKHVWFNGKIKYITYDFLSAIIVNEVSFLSGNKNGGDEIWAKVQYSSDGENYIDITTSGVTSLEEKLEETISARYVRLYKTSDIGWNALKYFYVNSDSDTKINVSGLSYSLSNMNNNVYSIIDNNLDTTVWYDWKFESGSYIELDLRKITKIKNIIFLQGGYVDNSDSNKTNGVSDILSSGQLSYSTDGNEFIKVETFNSVKNIYHEFNVDISARYVRMTYVGEMASSSGLIVREFAVNFTKVNPIITYNDSLTYTYTGEEIKGYYRYSYESNMKVSYINSRTKETLSTLPINPGEYEIVFTSEGNDIYNSYSESTNIHIYDTSTHFISDFNNIISSICSIDSDSINAFKNLIERYDYDLSNEDKVVVNETNYTGADNNTYTIEKGIAYLKERINLLDNASSMNKLITSSTNNSLFLILFVISLSSILIGIYGVSKIHKKEN